MFGNPYSTNDPRYYQYEQLEAAKRLQQTQEDQLRAADAQNDLLEEQNSLLEDANHQQWYASLTDAEKILHVRRQWGPMYARHTPEVLAGMSEEARHDHLKMREIFENDPLNYDARSCEFYLFKADNQPASKSQAGSGRATSANQSGNFNPNFVSSPRQMLLLFLGVLTALCVAAWVLFMITG
jgi:hypothetical protein